MSINEITFFSLFIGFILGVLLLDLGVFNKKTHVVSFKEAAVWSGVWVGFAAVFYFILLYKGDIVHGIDNIEELKTIIARYVPDNESLKKVTVLENDFEQSLVSYRKNMALEFITGYLLEYSLSVDNIFVIILILTSFGVRERYYKKVLFWGILGALLMRFLFIFVGSALIQQFHWVIYIFGAVLIWSGGKFIFEKEEEKINPDNHWVIKLVSRYFNVFPRYIGDRFFLIRNGKLILTPLFLVVIVIEFTDLVFAIDSVPAVFSVTVDPYIVFFSNIFAILGLRSMFFFLSNIMHWFRFLKIGLSVLLVFIGFKMIFFKLLLEPLGFQSHYSLYIILLILFVSIMASVLFPAKNENKEPQEVA